MAKKEEAKSGTSKRFLIALSVVSILGFLGIISETLFAKDISGYIEAAWLMVIGAGILIETQLGKVKSIKKGITSTNFTQLITLVLGIIAVLAGVFSLPDIKITNPGFLAIKGLVSIIAIIIIFLQTWIIEGK